MLDKITAFSLNQKLIVVLLFVIVAGFGILSYGRLPIDAFPDVTPSLVQVFTETRGLAPEEVVMYVTYPVEVAMNGLPDVKEIRSVSNFGLSVVNVYFEDGTDIYFARQLVNERLQEARGRIPEGFGEPQMGPIATGMGQVLFYYLEDERGTRSAEEMREIQDWIVKYHLQTVPGVTEVLGIGGYEKQFQISVDPRALIRYSVTIPEIIAALNKNNQNRGAQFIEKNSEEYIIRSVGLASGIADLENTVIKSYAGTPILIKQVAEVKTGGGIRRGLQTLNGVREVVAGQVIKLFGTNSSTVIREVEQKTEEINAILPEGMRIVPYYDQKSLVEACIGTVTGALFQGIILVILVLFLFMGGIRPSIIVALSIPFSVLVGFILMHQFDISSNLMSLGGLAIAIGMMVDGTIVIVDNIDRKLRERGEHSQRRTVIAEACLDVGKPIFYAIAIIIVVFLPLFTLQGVEGKMFRPLAYTVAMAMFGSLVYAILIAPAFSWLLAPRSRINKGPGRDPGNNQLWIVRLLLRAYYPVLHYLLRRRKSVVAGTAALLAIGGLLYAKLGSEFTPSLQEGTIVLKLTMAPSISLEESKRTAMGIERMVMAVPEVTKTVTRIGRGEVGAHTDPVNSAEIYISLRPKDEWREAQSQDELVEVIRRHLGNVPGVLLNFTQPIEMTIDELTEGIKAELAIKIFGDDLSILKTGADEIVRILSGMRGAEDVQADQVSGKPQLRIRIKRDAIARHGISIHDVQETISAAIGGEVSGQIFDGIRRFDILVRLAPEFRFSKETIAGLLIPSPDGSLLPLAQLAAIEEIIGPRQITRENNNRFITIQCNVEERDIGSFVEEGKRLIDERIALPPGYLVTWGGQFRLQEEAQKRFRIVIPITHLIIFVLMYLNFHSLKSSVLILLNIPLALVGGVIGLWLSGEYFSVPASIGFIALFGIALENGMVLVAYLNKLTDEGLDAEEASVTAAVMRIRPVLMTAATTALGLLPLILASGTGSEVQRPLAIVVLGGLATSTVLTLFVLPCLYKWFAGTPRSSDNHISL